MNVISMKAYRAKNIEFVGTLAPGSKIHLENKYTYNVRYANNQHCAGELTCEVFDKEHENEFKVKVVVEGIFTYDPSATREELHILTYKELFPYARMMVSSVTTVAGIPPVIIPAADIENQSIIRIDTEHLKP